jgi:hypothetical protein
MQNDQSQGIDLAKAFEILAARSAEQPLTTTTTTHTMECSCNSGVQEEFMHRGQRIDMNANNENIPNVFGEEELLQLQQLKLDEDRTKRKLIIDAKLNGMSVKELLVVLMKLQEQRVETYRNFDHGLERVLKTDNVPDYLNVCAEATTAFSVLSEQINTIKTTLGENCDRADLSKLISSLQDAEKNKLNYTAALHLEKIRQYKHQVDEEQTHLANSKIAELFKEGIDSMRAKIAGTIEAINDILEEIRYALLEEK